MTDITEFISILVRSMSSVEAALLGSLLAVIVLALTWPQRKRRRDFSSRDDEYQRLQKL